MIQIIVDTELQSKLPQTGAAVQICDQTGHVIGYFQPAAPSGRLKDLSPFSDEDIEQFSQQGEGRPLAEIWKDLEGRHGV